MKHVLMFEKYNSWQEVLESIILDFYNNQENYKNIIEDILVDLKDTHISNNFYNLKIKNNNLIKYNGIDINYKGLVKPLDSYSPISNIIGFKGSIEEILNSYIKESGCIKEEFKLENFYEYIKSKECIITSILNIYVLSNKDKTELNDIVEEIIYKFKSFFNLDYKLYISRSTWAIGEVNNIQIYFYKKTF